MKVLGRSSSSPKTWARRLVAVRLVHNLPMRRLLDQ